MEMTKRPYELLIRWDEKTGEMKGSHVKWVYTGTDEDGEQVVNVSKAKPLDLGRGEGYPLGDILAASEVEALALYEEEKRGRLEAEEARDTAEHARRQAVLDRDEALSVRAAAEQAATQAQGRREAVEQELETVRVERDALREAAETAE